MELERKLVSGFDMEQFPRVSVGMSPPDFMPPWLLHPLRSPVGHAGTVPLWPILSGSAEGAANEVGLGVGVGLAVILEASCQLALEFGVLACGIGVGA
jgi:hypothetical protein